MSKKPAKKGKKSTKKSSKSTKETSFLGLKGAKSWKGVWANIKDIIRYKFWAALVLFGAGLVVEKFFGIVPW